MQRISLAIKAFYVAKLGLVEDFNLHNVDQYCTGGILYVPCAGCLGPYDISQLLLLVKLARKEN